MNNPGIENATLTDWVNEFIDFICFNCNSLTIKPQDYIVIDIAIMGIFPTDYWNTIKWYFGTKEYTNIKVREDNKIIFAATGTYTLIYNTKPIYADTSKASVELPVDSAYHNLFFDYLKGKFYAGDGEGDEETVYGQQLINGARGSASQIATSKQNGSPVVPKSTQPKNRGEVTDCEED